MSEFTQRNWKEALTAAYLRSLTDSTFRSLCVTDPVAAIKEVSDIELPAAFKFKFVENRDDVVYQFLLPPLPTATANVSGDQIAETIRWATLCTDPTTDAPPTT